MGLPEISTLESLRAHLQGAIELEHATLPPYLCALYSIQEGANSEAAELVKSVLLDEMVHLLMAANLLNAVGGSPVIDSPEFLPRYPATLPFSNRSFEVPLLPFSPEALQVFCRLERPEVDDAPAEADGFETIGQFYQALEEGLAFLTATLGEEAVFSGDPGRQIGPEQIGGKAGWRIVVVTDLASALRAVDEIEEQGEGLKHAEVWDGERDMFHPDLDEVAHYFRFTEITQARRYRRGDTPRSGPTGEAIQVDWAAVHPMRIGARMADYPDGSPVREKMTEFNQAYCGLLRFLHRTVNGESELLGDLFGAMMEVREVARELMLMPSGDGVTSAGPSFEYVAPT